jgi:hypothetical protein
MGTSVAPALQVRLSTTLLILIAGNETNVVYAFCNYIFFVPSLFEIGEGVQHLE